MQLNDKALLVQLNISEWTARKLDKTVSAEVADNHGATRDAGNFRKKLLPMSDSLDKVKGKTALIRREFDFHTLPWGIKGTHILPTTNYLGFMSTFRKHRSEWEHLVTMFLGEYEYLIRSAAVSLGSMFDRADYPDLDDVRSKFDMDMVVLPVPTADFRVNLANEELDMIQRDVERRVQASAGDAMKAVWQRLYDQVALMAKRLGAPDGNLYDSLISNTAEICSVLTKLNFTDDPNLEAMRQEVERSLTVHTKDTIKADPVLRASLATEAEDIARKMGAFMGGFK